MILGWNPKSEKEALDWILKIASKKRSDWPKPMDEMTETERKIAETTCEYAGDLISVQQIAEAILERPNGRPEISDMPSAHDLKIIKAVQEFSGTCSMHSITDCETCGPKK